eukprot:Rmarinus@m.22914
MPTFQDGESSGCAACGATQRLPDQDRHLGRVFACSDSPLAKAIPPLPVAGGDVRVRSYAVRPQHSTEGVHKTPASGHRLPSGAGSTMHHISGRHSSGRRVDGGVTSSHEVRATPPAPTGLRSQRPQVSPVALQATGVSGDDGGHGTDDVPSSSGQDQEPSSPNQEDSPPSRSEEAHSLVAGIIDGEDGVGSCSDTPSKTFQPAASLRHESDAGRSAVCVGGSGQSLTGIAGRAGLVVGEFTSLQRPEIRRDGTHDGPIHGRVGHGLGRSDVPRQQDGRDLGLLGEQPDGLNQLERTEGGPADTTGSSAPPLGGEGAGADRQRDDSGLSAQPRGSSSASDEDHEANSRGLHVSSSGTSSGVPAGSTQHDSRSAVEDAQVSTSGEEVGETSATSRVTPVGTTHGGRVRESERSNPSEVLDSETSPSQLGGERTDDVVEERERLGTSSAESDSVGVSEDPQRTPNGNPSPTVLANSDLVAGASQAAAGRSDLDITSIVPAADTSRGEDIRAALTLLGNSDKYWISWEKTLSTTTVTGYDSMWRTWKTWHLANGQPAFSITGVDLLAFMDTFANVNAAYVMSCV